ncbi:hypothetical protein C8R45DRAFT_1150311 [Mycena sanguinolenta]|nr:hypothetical protein C8R45DRAFT_1150311 [Mycena sanguinolenta]
MAEFLLHAERWVHVSLPPEYHFLALLSSAQGRLSWLETLGLDQSVTSAPRDGADLAPAYWKRLEEFRIFEDVPKLRSLSLTPANTMENFPRLPWHQLTQICTSMQDNQVIERVLEFSPRLHAITFYSGFSRWNTQHQIHPRRSPDLQKIVLFGLKCIHGPSIMDVLTAMETPALKELSLVGCWAGNTHGVSSLLQRSCCFLETLVLEQTSIRPTELLGLFPLIPTLGTLVLVDNIVATVTNRVLEALTPCGLNVGMLPSLHTFVFRGTTCFCSTDKLLALLKSRMGSRPIINVDIALYVKEFGTSDLDKFAVLPGGVVVTHSPTVLSICAGSRWRHADRSHIQLPAS